MAGCWRTGDPYRGGRLQGSSTVHTYVPLDLKNLWRLWLQQNWPIVHSCGAWKSRGTMPLSVWHPLTDLSMVKLKAGPPNWQSSSHHHTAQCTLHTLQKYVGWKDSLFSQTFSWELDVCTFLRKPYMTTTFPIRKNKTISKLSQKNFDTPLTTPQVKIEFLCPTNRKSLYHGGTIIGKFWSHQNMKINFIFSM